MSATKNEGSHRCDPSARPDHANELSKQSDCKLESLRTQQPSLVSDWHRVGAGLSVRFSFRDERLDAEWRSRPPTKREWKRVLDRYRAGRDSFVLALATQRGGKALILEVQP